MPFRHPGLTRYKGPANHNGRMQSIGLVDMQSGGDVSRIIVSGVGHLPGGSVLEQMRFIETHGDGLRRLLLSEPYGDPYMSLDLIVPPGNPEAQAGYIIMEAMGYPLYSGSNTICTATAILQSGIVPMEEGEQSLVLESPAGLAHVTATNRNGRCETITTRGEPAYVAARDQVVDVPRYGKVRFDLVWSGAYFAVVDASAYGFRLQEEEVPALAAFGDALVTAARPYVTQEHPELGRVGPLPFAHFMGPLETVGSDGYRSPSATYVHPGVICRSPTGTGTSARLALMHEAGEIQENQWLETVSPRGSSFIGTVLGQAKVGDHRATDSQITGKAWTLARSEVVVDLDDPLVDASDLEAVLDTPVQ